MAATSLCGHTEGKDSGGRICTSATVTGFRRRISCHTFARRKRQDGLSQRVPLRWCLMSKPTSSELAPRQDPSQQECREAVRHPCRLEAFCRAVNERTGLSWQVSIVNISVGGIKLRCSRQFTRGVFLKVEVEDAPAWVRQDRLARVVHVRRESAGDWIIGCVWGTQLAESDLKALLS